MLTRVPYLTCLLLLLCGCGLSSASAGPSNSTSVKHAPRPFHAFMAGAKTGYSFQPARITVRAGALVTWTNRSDADHTVTAADGSWSSTNIHHGQSYSRRFRKPGTYSYVCALHGFMRGTVIVSP